MNTPICDFVKAYAESNALRLHMPGHKGAPLLGMENMDITEIAGADVLYAADGIIRESEQNAANLFGTAKTVYSAEGSSLCIRAMLYLALLHAKAHGKRPLIAAGRNAHKAFMTAAALLDMDICWLYGERSNLLCCEITPAALDACLSAEKPAAVYITSPDYLGNIADIAALATVCRKHGVLLLVDNAHGAYLHFLSEDRHPLTLGADMCCDSAHKTLPALTGGAYLHISKTAPTLFCEQAERAMALFASTSPSYLILQSLDAVNAYLADGYRERLTAFAEKATALKNTLREKGYTLVGDEPLKITVAAKPYGYTGHELAGLLQKDNIVCEFCDPDYLTLMFTPETGGEGLVRLENALLSVPSRTAICQAPPPVAVPQRKLSPREALFSQHAELPIEQCRGKVLASAAVSCPPAVPIVVCGEVIDETAIGMFRYYGIETCQIVYP